MWSATYEPDPRAELFFRALDDIDDNDNNNDEKLKQWISKYPKAINEEIILVENLKDSHRGKILQNMGSPLYVSVIRDIPKAVRILLEDKENTADVNYVHPNNYGARTAFLHCVDRGYDLCLQELLKGVESSDHGIDPSVHVTAYSKYLLGQGLPLYEEGGLNPLFLAAYKGHTEVVNTLLSSCPKDWIKRWLLLDKDAIGRHLHEVLFDLMAVETTKVSTKERTKTLKYDALRQIAHLLLRFKFQEEEEGIEDKDGVKCTKKNMSIEQYMKANMPSQKDAIQREKERLHIVRSKCLHAEVERKKEKQIKGMKIIQKYYTPLHPEVYDVKTVRKACNTASFQASLVSSVEEPVKGVYTFPFLDQHFCDKLWNEIHHYEKYATEQLRLNLPLFVRHDGNIGDLQVCGFRPLLNVLADVCQLVFRRCLEQDGMTDSAKKKEEKKEDPEEQKNIEIYHAFLTRNYVGRESNATFRMHRDKSDLTLNICLHASNDFEGSTVGFYQNESTNQTKKDGKVAEEQEKKDDKMPHDDDRIYTHVHKVGYAVVHSGKSWHRTDPITKGTRGSLIVWAKR